MKICSRCEIEKALSDFRKDSRRRDGHVGTCKMCQKSNKKAPVSVQNMEVALSYAEETKVAYSSNIFDSLNEKFGCFYVFAVNPKGARLQVYDKECTKIWKARTPHELLEKVL